VHPERYSDEFGRLLKRAGLRRTTRHDSRHTTLTLVDHDPGLRICGALGGTRTPNLLIRRSVPSVRPVHCRPYLQVKVHQASDPRPLIRYRSVSL
jgi:hypothetical protein